MDVVIEEFKLVHGSKYDYSDLEYVNGSSKIKIGCPVHGWFYQTASEHKYGYGCAKCANNEPNIPHDKWLDDCKIKHNNYYDYTHVSYKNMASMVDIICRKHGMFSQQAGFHRNGNGCKKCGDESKSLKFQEIFTTESFITKLKNTHGESYDYSAVQYITLKHPITLICRTHGPFTRFPQNLLKGGGCDKCLELKRTAKALRRVEKHFKDNDIEVVIDENNFNGFGHNIHLNCSKHGHFERFLDMNIFVLNHPCLKCGSKISNLEKTVSNFLDGLGVTYTQHNRYRDDSGKGFEIDILVPDKMVGFEINGLRFHGENIGKTPEYHTWKTTECLKLGIKLIHIYENEISACEVYKDKIYRTLNFKHKPTDNVVVKYVDNDIASQFLNEHHPLGTCGTGVNIVACDVNGNIYGCAVFKNNLLLRVASKYDIDLYDNFYELATRYMVDYNLSSLSSKVLCDWDDVDLYKHTGFAVKDTIPPVCWKFISAKHNKIYDNDEELISDNVDKFWDTGGYFMEFSI